MRRLDVVVRRSCPPRSSPFSISLFSFRRERSKGVDMIGSEALKGQKGANHRGKNSNVPSGLG